MIKEIILIVCILAIGYCIHGFYDDYRYNHEQSKLEGLWLKGFNETEAETYAYSRTKGNGEWVCVNIKGLSFERAVQVCQHEAGHELFAELCEENITRCKDL